MSVRIHVSMHAHTHACVCVYICMRVIIHMCVCVCVCVCPCLSVCMSVCIYVCMYIYVCILVHAHTHVHRHKLSHFSSHSQTHTTTPSFTREHAQTRPSIHSLSLSLSHTHTHIAFIISQKIRFKDSKKDQLTLLARECIMSPSAGSAWGGVAVHFASRFLFEHISYDSATMSHMNTTSTTHAQPGSCWKRHWHMHGPPASLCRCFLFKQFRGIHKSQVCSIQISYVYILPTDIRQQNAHVICWKHASFVKLLHPEAESACVKATNSHTVLYNF